jgi:hypothetical protein
VNQIGDAHLRPEVQGEFEGGVDLGFLGDRVTVQATYYNKRSSHALESLELPTSFGAVPQWYNVGSVWNWGYEAELSARLLAMKGFEWDISGGGSVNHNQLVSLGAGQTAQYNPLSSLVQGYPLFSSFELPYTVVGANHGGVVEPSQVEVGSTNVYHGYSFPPFQWTLSSGITLLNGTLRLSAQLDHRGDFDLLDQTLISQDASGVGQAVNDPRAPRARQAAAIALTSSSTPTLWGYYFNGAFTRLREVALTVTVPHRLSAALRTSSLSMTISARNVALWTRYPGDPEVNAAPGNFIGQPAYYDLGSLAPTRYWLLRVNAGI